MKSLLLLSSLLLSFIISLASAKYYEGHAGKHPLNLFKFFNEKWEKKYESEHHKWERYQIFQKNLKTIDEMNAREGKPVYGITKFSDLTPEEFQQQFLPEMQIKSLSVAKQKNLNKPVFRPLLGKRFPELPTAFDWRSHDAVTAVGDQGVCYSYWSFSAVGAIESQWFLHGHPLTQLSVQQSIDCATNTTQPCDGGDPIMAYQHIINAKGLMSASDYPYRAKKSACQYNTKAAVARIRDWMWVTRNESEQLMQLALISEGPLSACIDARTFQFYFGGIIQHWCGTSINHCVVITGFEQRINWLDEYIDVWLVKNSWGEGFGENGYVFIERNKNLCGISDFVTLPLV